MTPHIVFDLGKVLIDWQPELAFVEDFPDLTAIRDWMARVGFHDWNRAQDGGRSLADGLAVARAQYGDVAAPLEHYAERFSATITEPVPGSWQIAEGLAARGHRLFALTNWAHDTWPVATATYPRLTTLFEDIVVSGLERMAKPDPEIFHLMCRRNGISPDDSVFIDDSAANVAAAAALGMDAIRFTDAADLHAALTERGLA